MGYGVFRSEIIYSVPVEGKPNENETQIFRSPVCPDSIAFLEENGMRTLYQLIERSVELHSNNNWFGTRVKEKGGNFGDYEWMTYAQVWEQANWLQSGLAQIDVFSDSPENLKCFGIFSKNRVEWIIFDLACLMQNVTSIPMVDSQGDKMVNEIIEFTCLTSLAISRSNFSRIIRSKKQGFLKNLRKLIQFEDLDEAQSIEAEQNGLEIFSMRSVISAGQVEQIEHVRPNPDDVFTVCFTSGSTGSPKGALITHQNIVSLISSIQNTSIHIHPSDCALSYLPLSHMMERIAIWTLSYAGGSIGFYSGDISEIRSDLASLQPTVFVSVPRLFNRFYQLIRQRLDETTGISRMLLNRALNVKLFNVQTNGKYTHMIYDRLIFKNIRNILGGRVRYMITGSAPISTETINFLKAVFCCPVIEVYGQTETCGAAFCTQVNDIAGGNVGGPFISAEFKLISVPEMRYSVNDTNERGQHAPRGEILIRGPIAFKGYYQNPSATAESLDENGWVHTGDIGVILPDNGALKIIDRRRNHFKLAQGEYVAVQKVECILLTSLFASQVFIYGDSMQSCLVGIVVPNQNHCIQWAANNQVEYANFEELCRHQGLKGVILDDFKRVSREAGLPGYEIVANIHLEPNEWTPENLLTYSHKFKRFSAKEYYANTLAALYTELEG